MVCMYSRNVWAILFGMILTGAARSIAVKVAYQSGFKAPLTVTLLYLAGQALSLLAYIAQKKFPYYLVNHEDQKRRGSSHGLSVQSEERIQWIHHVPWYAKPAIPALSNLMNSALRWTSLIYIDASVAEMLISGMELILGVVAAKIFRSRRIGTARWVGVLLVTIGIVIIERANSSKQHQNSEEQSDDGTSRNGKEGDAAIGVILIILQSILSVVQDTTEEIFMQAAEFPPTLMLGMEGLYGFCIGLVLYLSVGDKLGIEDTVSTFQFLSTNKQMRWWIVGLPILFLITGIFNIKSTEVTSAMTRNVWKNLRTALVWVTALGIFYVGGNSDYGEAWYNPESYFILIGLIVMATGIVVYYWFKTGIENRNNADEEV
jgi:drug/metabolite transporter (DMT)-like permease